MRIALNYTLCAIIATLVNISSQELSLAIYQSAYSITVSVLVGTAVGLIVKYVLDKRYIFRFQATDAKHDSFTFAIYTLMGLATTVVFWGFEFGFDYLFGTKQMRYLGGVLGLALGYYIKYQLDKRFVFVTRGDA